MNKLRLAVASLALGAVLYMALAPVSSAGPTDTPSNAVPASPVPATGTNAQARLAPQDDLIKQIQTWIDSMAVQTGFEAWKNAQWTHYALGPGTHGWVVILKQAGAEVGYLVVSATPEGSWTLTEYGTGSSPLFSLTTLYRSLVQLALIADPIDPSSFETVTLPSDLVIERLYHSPLHALWKVIPPAAGEAGTIYIDAKTGEQLPLSPDPWRRLPSPTATGLPADTAAPRIENALELEGFDPFHHTSWLRGTPLKLANFAQLQQALRSDSSVTYVADLYDRRVLAPFAVTGYAVWAGASVPFIRLEQEGSRYIPLQELFENGFFFP